MKIALFSLPRSRSECMFDALAPIAEQLGMSVYRPTSGNYYYIDNDTIDPNMFCKIDTRTDINLFKKSFRFRSPTKQIPTESFLSAVIKFCLRAISLTSSFVKSASGKIHLSNSFSLTSCRKYV